MLSDDANSSSENDSTDQNPSPSTSIDKSLDAIEGQLTSISLNNHISPLPAPSIPPDPQNIDTLPPDSYSQVEEVVVVENSVLQGEGGVDTLPSDSHTHVEEVVVENVIENENSVLWRNNSYVEVEGEGQGSPSSSGYAGGKGTSSSSSAMSGSGIEEISGDEVDHGELVRRSGSFGGSVDSEWVPGKRHVNEVRFISTFDVFNFIITAVHLYSVMFLENFSVSLKGKFNVHCGW